MNVAWQDEQHAKSEPELDYPQQWRAYALRRRIALILLWGWPAVVLGLFYVSRYNVHHPLRALGIVVVWLVPVCASIWWAGEFRCPRCLRRYGALGHRRGWNPTRGIFDQVCSNCKLRKFERRTPQAQSGDDDDRRQQGNRRRFRDRRRG